MNKGRRNELRELHYKRRLLNYGIKDDSAGNFHAFKTTGKPCSCYACSQPESRYNRSQFRQEVRRILTKELTYEGDGGEESKALDIFCDMQQEY